MSWWTSHRGTVLGAVAGAASLFVPALAPYAATLISGGAKLGGAIGDTPEAVPYGPTQDGGNLNMSGDTTRLAPVTTTAQGSNNGINWGNLAGSVASSGLSYLGGQQANVANAKQAQAQMDFQAQQTGTSYQRGVADMRAAGLNPMLGYSQGGASSGAGASAHIGDAISPAVTSGFSGLKTLAELGATKAQIENTNAQTDYTNSQTAMQDVRTAQIVQDTQTGAASAKRLASDTEEIKARTPQYEPAIAFAKGSLSSRLATAAAESRSAELDARLKGLGVERDTLVNRGIKRADSGLTAIEGIAKGAGEAAGAANVWANDYSIWNSAKSFINSKRN